ncbi:uncharacterized protein E0L32_010495 [Thyridium curvatum]|uniref:Uncharacterized protein n=1 Tax=Thyridium curvatum TaxID=1093900 RepID=A0A507ASF2_9PEZI|nr:uncharacterized protein E0L32_010495 [Thyridium curvatum]TPX07808.1 hypothetical protein E0L32_010495 [Thyridium curvatum]
MASNAAVTPSQGRPLAGFAKLSPCVLHYRPESNAASAPAASGSSPTPTPTPPKLIVFCGWMGARDAHLAKYIAQHQALYPSAQILLIRCTMAHMLFPSTALSQIKPAATAVRAALSDGGSSSRSQQKQEMLVHSFSNGGSAMLWHLYKVYGEALPPHSTILDSAPGQFEYRSTITALTAGQPWLALPLAHLFATAHWFALRVLRRADPLARPARAHNDRAGGNANEVRRAYVFSKEDKLVSWRHVEENAREARAAGFTVRLEEFLGTPHVAHARADPERYWRIVRETWEGELAN